MAAGGGAAGVDGIEAFCDVFAVAGAGEEAPTKVPSPPVLVPSLLPFDPPLVSWAGGA